MVHILLFEWTIFPFCVLQAILAKALLLVSLHILSLPFTQSTLIYTGFYTSRLLLPDHITDSVSGGYETAAKTRGTQYALKTSLNGLNVYKTFLKKLLQSYLLGCLTFPRKLSHCNVSKNILETFSIQTFLLKTFIICL